NVVDSASHSSIQPLTLAVSALRITTLSLPAAITGHAYNQQFASTGGIGAVTWSLWTGSLPTGLTLSGSGVISGTATVPGSSFSGQAKSLGIFNFTVQVTDQTVPPQTDSRPLTLNVSTGIDQSSSWDSNQPTLAFGNGTRIGERVITGVTGTLRAVRVNSLDC